MKHPELLGLVPRCFGRAEDPVSGRGLTLSDCPVSALAMFGLKYPLLLSFEQDPCGGRMLCANAIVISLAIRIDIFAPMRTIQMTMDQELLERVDSHAKRLGITRSAFARSAFKEALNRFNDIELEERQIQGYRRIPVSPHEFGIPESDQAWGDDAWGDE